jgi:hypothetical protein
LAQKLGHFLKWPNLRSEFTLPFCYRFTLAFLDLTSIQKARFSSSIRSSATRRAASFGEIAAKIFNRQSIHSSERCRVSLCGRVEGLFSLVLLRLSELSVVVGTCKSHSWWCSDWRWVTGNLSPIFACLQKRFLRIFKASRFSWSFTKIGLWRSY